MASKFSLREALCVLDIFCERHVTASSLPSPCDSLLLTPSATKNSQSTIQENNALITTFPELRFRNAFPEPQNAVTCQQSDQSASQAIQQAAQQASQSIQQASQQIVQSAAQASRSASQGIQQAQQSASQSIADAQRSVSSVISSASVAIASAQASASSAISRANLQMQSAEISASDAVGSAFLAAAARATQSVQESISACGAAATSQVALANQQVKASQKQAMTATQAAFAIVGSVIASILLTASVYFLIIRHKKKAKRRLQERQSPGSAYSPDEKFPVSDQVGETIATSQSNYASAVGQSSRRNPSMFGKKSSSNDSFQQTRSDIKTSIVPWNPTNPPEAPTLGSWLKIQAGVPPLFSLNLPAEINEKSPPGNQRESIHSSMYKAPPSTLLVSKLPLRSPILPVVIGTKPAVTLVTIPPRPNPTVRKIIAPSPRSGVPDTQTSTYRESKASVWTDDVPDNEPSPDLPSPREPSSITRGYTMKIPLPKDPRSTAEWMTERSTVRDSPNDTTSGRSPSGFGLPNNAGPSKGWPLS